MALTCTRCDGSGFLHLHQIDDGTDLDNRKEVLRWIEEHKDMDYDVQVCDCCGDGEEWYGIPGEHYNVKDPPGPHGPYASNGGLCRCH